MRVLIFSHGHPMFSKGGGEIAAYHLFQAINESAEHEAFLVARAPESALHLGSPIAALSEREYLISGNADIPNLTATIALGEGSDFAALLRELRPDAIHFHHYVLLGVEFIRAAHNACPDARIALTLHEYIAICVNNGQMIKTDSRLCYRSSPLECHQCFPDRSPEDFFLRERYIKTFFDLVDVFVSPSRFLRERYIAWGIAPERIVVIENGQPQAERLPPRPLGAGKTRGRFAYFGQITPYKGLDLILDAFSRLSDEVRRQVSLDIFGAGLEYQPAEFRERVAKLLEANGGTVHYHGAYELHELGRLMTDVDWVLLGSIWWENSPLVIQEAHKFGRPVVCPDIGGMAEKVEPGVGGFHYRARDPLSLASLVETLAQRTDGYETLCAGLPKPATVEASLAKHLEIYSPAGAAAARDRGLRP